MKDFTKEIIILEKIKADSENVITEFLRRGDFSAGNLIVIGCSTSEVVGNPIGTSSSEGVAQKIWETIFPIICSNKLHLAIQCCEHLNRVLVTEREIADTFGLEIVNVIPRPNAGGAFATVAYSAFDEPVMVEFLKSGICKGAQGGIDIGGTLIGMHLQHVAVPIKFENNIIGKALVAGAYARPKYIGENELTRVLSNNKLKSPSPYKTSGFFPVIRQNVIKYTSNK